MTERKNVPLYFIGIFVLLLAVIAAYRYYDYVHQGNFILQVSTECDPSEHSCFVADCSPDEDPDCDVTPYENVELLAKDAPACLLEHTCEAYSCEGNDSCSISYCSEDELEDGVLCTSPDS